MKRALPDRSKKAKDESRSRPAAAKKKPAIAKRGAFAKSPSAAGKPAASKPAPRVDLGAPVDGFFAKQPPHLRPILDQLRQLVVEVAPEASSSIKWGMPFYLIGGQTLCALAGFKAHVNLILPGPPGTFDDPDERLEGDGKTGRHLKVRNLEELPRAAVRGWLQTAAKRARNAT